MVRDFLDNVVAAMRYPKIRHIVLKIMSCKILFALSSLVMIH